MVAPMQTQPTQMHIRRAALNEMDAAYEIVCEYYEAVGVLVREDRASFEHQYSGEGAGVWLASAAGDVVGCIALRRLSPRSKSGEIKRLYVRPEHRGHGIAEALLHHLEKYARNCGYKTLFLDSKKDLMPAVRFYRRHGYKFCGRYNDNPQATIFMRKEL